MMSSEDRNPNSYGLDLMSTSHVLTLINNEDQTVALSVRDALDDISRGVELLVSAFEAGGRVIYLGAGSSARLAVADVAELTPTYGLPQERFLTIIAGGREAVFRADERTEDHRWSSVEQLEQVEVGRADVAIGLTASGTTPFVASGLEYAARQRSATILIACNPSKISADVKILVPTGPEVVTGSTRMKAATAQRMVLTMMSTAMAVRLGLVYENLMVALKGQNAKCMERARRIVQTITNEDDNTCQRALETAGYDARVAVLLIRTGDPERAVGLLKQAKGSLRTALAELDRVE